MPAGRPGAADRRPPAEPRGPRPPPAAAGAMTFFGFGQTPELELVLSDAESRRRVEHKTEEGKKEKYFLFYDGETVSGRVVLTLKNPHRRLEHQGIKVEFIGQIGERGGRGASSPPAQTPLSPPLAGPGQRRRAPRRCRAGYARCRAAPCCAEKPRCPPRRSLWARAGAPVLFPGHCSLALFSRLCSGTAFSSGTHTLGGG